MNDPIIIARKRDFEKKFKNAVMSNPKLKAKYGNVWDDIAEVRPVRKNLTMSAAELLWLIKIKLLNSQKKEHRQF